jgi:hypothetical protein
MKKTANRKIYSAPCIKCVELDNEISLVLESALSDPNEPGALTSQAPEYFNSDPFKINLG